MPTPAEIPPIKLLEVTNGYVPRLTSSKAPCAPSKRILLLASWRFLMSAIIFPRNVSVFLHVLNSSQTIH